MSIRDQDHRYNSVGVGAYFVCLLSVAKTQGSLFSEPVGRVENLQLRSHPESHYATQSNIFAYTHPIIETL